MASDKFMMSYEIVNELISDMVEVTSKQFEECNSDFRDNEINCSPKQESSGSEINCDNKDLPVRRSSRIKHLTVQQDKVKKKNGSKQNKSIKNSESKPIDENCRSPPKEESIQIDVVSSKSGDEISDSKNEVLSDSNKNSKLEGAKSQKVKRAQKRVSSKFEKEDTKLEKSKTDKKKPTRKKKQNLTESVESSIDKVIDDVINASLIWEDPDTKSEILPLSNTTPCSVVVDNLNSEIQVPEISNNSTKQNDILNQDIKDKQSESNSLKPVKVKSRWWQSSKLEGVLSAETTNPSAESTTVAQQLPIIESTTPPLTSESKVDSKDQNNLIPNENCKEFMDTVVSTTEKPAYDHIDENIYRFERKKSKSKKQVRRMVCDCTLTKEETECGMLGCKEECLNRLLMIECGYRCPLGDACSNKRFQKKQYVNAEIIKTEKKGWGLLALEDVSTGDFLMEFVGEVLNHKEYRQRVKLYAKEKNIHCYFMALKTDEILDATYKGNLTRFINHSCDPNCETQK
ncbi:Histone-lysine N-methyltransferase SETD2, partial [Araneus ventricosus]